jgi:hypothetical protein
LQSSPAWARSETLSKITKAKRAGGMAPLIESLPSKHKPSVQTPVLPKKEKRKEKETIFDNHVNNQFSECTIYKELL